MGHREAMLAKAVSKFAVMFDGSRLRVIFVAWRDVIRDVKASCQRSAHAEKLSGMLMNFACSDAMVLRTYFIAFERIVRDTKRKRKQLGMVERFARSTES